jgi:hypothetical protein
MISGGPYVLVSFFQTGIAPCYVAVNQLVSLQSKNEKANWALPDPLTVDSLLERMVQESQAFIMAVDVPIESQWQQNKVVLFRTLSCSVELQLLGFAANYSAPKEKLERMMEAIWSMSPVKYSSPADIAQECKEMVKRILRSLL